MSGDNPFELDTTDSNAAKLQPSTAARIGNSSTSFSLGNPFSTKPIEDGRRPIHNEQNDENRKETSEVPSAGEQSDVAFGSTGQQRSVPGPTGDLVGGLLKRAAIVQDPATEEWVIRNMTFWRNGFQIQDNKLRRYDDPLQCKILEDINEGRAPPSVFNVHPGQLIEVRVIKRTDEDYVSPEVAKLPKLPTVATNQPQGTKCPTLTNPLKGTKPGRSGRPSNSESGSKWNIQSVLQCTGCSCY